MKELTFKNKKLNFSDKLEVIELKRSMIIEAGNRCSVCGELLGTHKPAELAHILAKHKNNIQKFSYEAIHSPLNMRITCSTCNPRVMINRSRKELVRQHLQTIADDLSDQGYDTTQLQLEIDKEI